VQGLALAGAAFVVALRTWTHVHNPRRERGATILERLASIAPVGAMAAIWWLRGVVEREHVFPEEWLGVALVIGGLAVRGWARATRRRAVRIAPGLRNGRGLLEDGPYRGVMHPAYAGSLLVEVGVCFFFAAWIVGLPLLVSTVRVLRRRIADDERVLRAAFGAAFDAYAATRARLLPGIY